jgi:ribonuclease HII
VTLSVESALRRRGVSRIVGVDEVGRGALAGPVVAAAVLLDKPMEGLADSKTLTRLRRLNLATRVVRSARVAVSSRAASEIDEVGIVAATFSAMRDAVAVITEPIDIVLVDGLRTIPGVPHKQQAVVRGDATCPAISAASIVAKVVRDAIMTHIDSKVPGYGFERHVGYGTRQHRGAIERLGPSDVHRRTFRLLPEQLTLRGTDARVSRGKRGEDAAVRFLERCGCEIVARNYRAASGEVDIIARDGDTVAFCEVKSSSSYSRPDERVDARKQRRIAAAAEAFIAQEGPIAGAYRFDVISVVWSGGRAEVVHYADAFRV